jgi:hypothetical protein
LISCDPEPVKIGPAGIVRPDVSQREESHFGSYPFPGYGREDLPGRGKLLSVRAYAEPAAGGIRDADPEVYFPAIQIYGHGLFYCTTVFRIRVFQNPVLDGSVSCTSTMAA